MAEVAGGGIVQQKNIDAIMNNVLSNYNGSNTFKTEINETYPSW